MLIQGLPQKQKKSKYRKETAEDASGILEGREFHKGTTDIKKEDL